MLTCAAGGLRAYARAKVRSSAGDGYTCARELQIIIGGLYYQYFFQGKYGNWHMDDHRKLVYHTLSDKVLQFYGKTKQVKTSSWFLGGQPHNAPSHGRLCSTPQRHVNSCPSNESALFVASCSMVTSSSARLRLLLHQIRRLKLVGLLSAGTGPLVASGVGELVAVRGDEVVEDGGSTGAWNLKSVYVIMVAKFGRILTVGVAHGDDLLVVVEVVEEGSEDSP